MTTQPIVLGADGKPARRTAQDSRCPQCGASPDKRVLSAGFGEPHDVCRICGHEFDERTLP